MKNIKEQVLDQVADSVLEMLKAPLVKGNLTAASADVQDHTVGIVSGTCYISSCREPNSAFYLHPITNKFVCKQCAEKFQTNDIVCRKIYPPVDVYEDGVVLIQNYNQSDQGYCIDMRYGTEEHDTYMLVHNGKEPNFDQPNLVKKEQYEQCIEDIEQSCILLIHYYQDSNKQLLDMLLNICNAVTITLKMLINVDSEQV